MICQSHWFTLCSNSYVFALSHTCAFALALTVCTCSKCTCSCTCSVHSLCAVAFGSCTCSCTCSWHWYGCNITSTCREKTNMKNSEKKFSKQKKKDRKILAFCLLWCGKTWWLRALLQKGESQPRWSVWDITIPSRWCPMRQGAHVWAQRHLGAGLCAATCNDLLICLKFWFNFVLLVLSCWD